ncbi:hypothetical protein [Aquirhabdus sp.]|uniref:hypothetical protein n=1 Tax=Aquirhabdus sp. TaxID=2824160 RepID=UPI00396CFB80
MKKLSAIAIGLTLALSGCSTMTPARYSVSVDNNLILKKYAGQTTRIISMDPPANYDSNCRLMGPIQASDGMTIPQFVQKAFNDELKFASIYSENGNSIAGALTKIQFSSASGLTSGWWDLGLTLKASNGKTISVENRYDFKSGFDAITACNQTAQALAPAVQDLIKKAISDPAFAELLQ